MMHIKVDLLQQFIKLFDKISSTPAANISGGVIKNKTTPDQQLGARLEDKLHKPIIRKFENDKV